MVHAPFKKVDDVLFLLAGHTDIRKVENVLNCLTNSGLTFQDIVIDKWEDKCAVYIKNDKWSLHHSSIIKDSSNWEQK